MENVITDKKIKEEFGDMAISILVNKSELDLKSDLKYLRIEFGYLFKRPNNNTIEAMFKITIPKKEKVFYFGTQDGELLLLNNQFTEDTFRRIQSDMFSIHNIDVQNINKSDYIMELY